MTEGVKYKTLHNKFIESVKIIITRYLLLVPIYILSIFDNVKVQVACTNIYQ